jgi:transposase
MVKLEKISLVRDLWKEGKTFKQIQEITGLNYRTVKKYIDKDDFNLQKSIQTQKRSSKIDPYKQEMINLLNDNKSSWYKQRLTASRLYSLMQDTHIEFDCSYNTIQRFVKNYRETDELMSSPDFSKLIWHPAEAQADFGEADFLLPNGDKKRYKYFVLAFPYSNYAYAQIYSGENCQCICQAMKNIFEHIGGVPRVILFDNASGAGSRKWDFASGSRTLVENNSFIRFRLHYGFEARFTNVYAGHEKGSVESNVGYIRRQMFVPEIEIPENIEEFNKNELFKLSEKLMKKRGNHYLKGIEVTELFKDDLAELITLPLKPFDVSVTTLTKVNNYNEITLDVKHKYKLVRNLKGSRVYVTCTAWKVTVHSDNGEFVEDFNRVYGEERTETVSMRTSINEICKKPNIWKNSKLRENIGLENPFVQYIDLLQDKNTVSSIFKTFRRTVDEYGFDKVLAASEELIESERKLSIANVTVVCNRLNTKGLNESDNCTGVDLKIYDNLVLPCKTIAIEDIVISKEEIKELK